MKTLLLIFMAGLFAGVAVSAPVINIVSDTTWKSSGVLVSGYTDAGFDDSSWSSTIVKPGYPYSPQSLLGLPDTIAEHMWHSDDSDYQVYMRKTFMLEKDTALALVHLRGDDGYHFYVNGNLVDSYTVPPETSWGHDHTVDITSYLHAGENVFAVEAWDVITLNRSMLVDARVALVPVPGALLLGSLGCGLAASVRSRLR